MGSLICIHSSLWKWVTAPADQNSHLLPPSKPETLPEEIAIKGVQTAYWEYGNPRRMLLENTSNAKDKAMGTLGYIIILNTFSSKYILCHSLFCRRHQELSDLCWRLKWLHYIFHTFLLAAQEPFWENIQTEAAVLESSEETAESNSDKASIKVNQWEIAAKCLMPAIYCIHTLQNVYAFGVCYTLPWQHQRAGKLCTHF